MSTGQNSCDKIGVPIRLQRNGKRKNPNFESSEALYRWFKPGVQHLPNGQISAVALGKVFRDPHDTSVNRSKHCEYCTDVLYDHNRGNHRFHCGVLEATVEETDGHSEEQISWIDHNGQTVEKCYEFKVLHEPEKCMYPHSVIAVYEGNERLKNKPSASTAKSALRAALSRFFTICHEPDENFQP